MASFKIIIATVYKSKWIFVINRLQASAEFVCQKHTIPVRQMITNISLVIRTSLPVKLFLAALSSTQDSPGEVKLPLALLTQRLDHQGQANEQTIALVEAIISKQMMVNSRGRLTGGTRERALQQLFDMPSFPIIHLYPNDEWHDDNIID